MADGNSVRSKKMKLDLGIEEDDALQINHKYAERYDKWRRLEELQKLKSRHGDSPSEDSDDSSSSEEPVEWSAEHEKDFLCTLAALKTRDPIIYSNQRLFNTEKEDNLKESTKKIKKVEKKKSTPMFLKDYERKLVLEKNGEIDEDGDEGEDRGRGYFEQQEMIKNELKAALDTVDDGDEPILVKRTKTEDQLEQEENEYYEWLRSGGNKDFPGSERLESLRNVWKDPNLNKDDQFLRDYLMNKDYDVDDSERIPTYEEIVDIERDERELEAESEFEKKYNFRFEEPDQEFIKTYPRVVKESLKVADDRRKQKRSTYKERKLREKKERLDEIRELKAIKKTEIEEKLQKLKRLTGDDNISIKVEDLEDDFDPAEYDKRMREIFDGTYYDKCEVDEEKPVFSDVSDSDDESDYDEMEIARVKNPIIDDSQSTKSNKNSEVASNEGGAKRKRKRNSVFANAILKEKPLFKPGDKTFEEYFNEYYSLNYEDVIADGLITKFKYRSVPANDFGLTVDEILNADDRQLNAWASLKKATAYRTEEEEFYDVKAYQKKAVNIEKKKKIFTTDFGGKKSKTQENSGLNNIKTVSLSDSKQNVEEIGPVSKGEPDQKITSHSKSTKETMDRDVEMGKKKSARRKKRGKGRKQIDAAAGQLDDDRIRAYGINPKKLKNKLFHSKRNN